MNLIHFLAGFLIVPAADHAIKWQLRRRLRLHGGTDREAGPIYGRLWLMKYWRSVTPRAIWIGWFVAALQVVLAACLVPKAHWFAGLLLGGSFSHMLETKWCGARVLDYLRVTRRYAVDLSDLAIWTGALGVVICLLVELA